MHCAYVNETQINQAKFVVIIHRGERKEGATMCIDHFTLHVLSLQRLASRRASVQGQSVKLGNYEIL